MKHSKTCEQCGKTFTKATLGAAATALSLHITRKHGRPGYDPKNPYKDKPELDASVKPRSWSRRKKKPSDPAVRYCPRCGCDMMAVAIAMSTISGMKG